MEKTCFKCNEKKHISEFYKHKSMPDGHLNKCKECAKMDVRKNRAKRIEYYREYDRNRGNRHPDGYIKQWREDCPLKYAAQTAVGNAVRDGRLHKPRECQECGLGHEYIHGHHDDYAYPLSVRWLCPACHKAWHDKNGEAPNGR